MSPKVYFWRGTLFFLNKYTKKSSLNIINLNKLPVTEYTKTSNRPIPRTTEIRKKYNRDIEFDNGVLEKLVEYDWPGNIRELNNFVERMFHIVRQLV